MSSTDILAMHLKLLRKPTAAEVLAELVEAARRSDWSPEDFARELLERELEGRRRRRVERILGGARLPPGKTLATLDTRRLPLRVRRMLPELCSGEFVDRADNVLVFGLPGRGKTHFACAVGYELAQSGRSVLFSPTFKIVARLLRAKRDLMLEAELRRLDRFDVLILDDIGYVQQDRGEMEVLFTLLAERYERRSVIITSNLVFSEWDRIFKDPMTTAAAIDRVVHHSVIVELQSRGGSQEESGGDVTCLSAARPPRTATASGRTCGARPGLSCRHLSREERRPPATRGLDANRNSNCHSNSTYPGAFLL